MPDPSWTQVWLTLAGAPVGAAITVLGVHLTNRSERHRVAAQSVAERDLARDAAEASVRAQAVQRALQERTDLYLKIAELCLLTEALPDAVAYAEDVQGLPGPDHKHFMQVAESIDKLRISAVVHAPRDVEQALAQVRAVSRRMGDDPSQDSLEALASEARSLRERVAKAAEADRSLRALVHAE